MPLYSFSGDEAVANRKSNPAGDWGNRSSGNRLEPVALPTFETPFHLEPGEPIFTIGSCFARNIETELMRRGFKVPMRDLFTTAEFSGLETTIINNFGTPSIFNEFNWGLRGGFKPEDHIVETRGGFVDLHLNPAIRPASYEVVVSRREAIRRAMATVADCRVVIMTLGLIEVWHDNQTGCYLNVAPRPSLLKDYPGRFDLHVLSFQEAYEHLERAFRLLSEHCRPDLQVILTVSPVPLTATHRPMDVMVANAYSKSVLRAVAEHAVAAFPFITYFPSYESVTLSDRQFAWKDDLIHVTEDIVALNVGRMIAAFASESLTDDLIAEIRQAAPVQAAARAAEMRTRPEAEAFFEVLGDLSRTNPDFAIEHARFLDETRRYQEVVEVLDGVESQPLLAAELRARALLQLRRPDEAAQAVEAVVSPKLKAGGLWELLIQAHGEADNLEGAVAAAARYREAFPFRSPRIQLQLFRALRRSRPEAALGYGLQAAETEEGVAAAYETAELLIDRGDIAQARALLQAARPSNERDRLRIERLSSLLPA